MTTNDVRDQLVLLVCDELDETDRASLEAAMNADPALAAEAAQLAEALRAITPSGTVRLGEDFSRRLRERVQMETAKRARGDAHGRLTRSALLKAALAAAAAILLAVGLLWWYEDGRGDKAPLQPRAWFSLLSQACAAENAALLTKGMVHIRNEIVVYPVATEHPAGTVPASGPAAPGYTWIPICALRADGRMAFHQLRLAQAGQAFTVEDSAWYDPASGRFARVVRTGDSVVFANSFDGSSIYACQPGPDGALRLTQAAVTKDFAPPKEPAAFLGISAGLRSSLDANEPMVQAVSDGKLADGAPARVYKVGLAGPDGQIAAHWLFKVRQSDGTLAEKEFHMGNQRQLSIRRVLTEPVQQPGTSWTLAELKERMPSSRPGPASVATDMVIPNVTVAQMVKRADFQTYSLARKPSWTAEAVIMDILDVGSPPKRMFAHIWRAEDGRHVVMVQSPTYNAAFGKGVLTDPPAYASATGFKLHRNADKEKWLAGILLNSVRAVTNAPPGEKRIAGLVLTPAATVIALAVNGELSDEELHGLIDGLVPAKDQE